MLISAVCKLLCYLLVCRLARSAAWRILLVIRKHSIIWYWLYLWLQESWYAYTMGHYTLLECLWDYGWAVWHTYQVTDMDVFLFGWNDHGYLIFMVADLDSEYGDYDDDELF